VLEQNQRKEVPTEKEVRTNTRHAQVAHHGRARLLGSVITHYFCTFIIPVSDLILHLSFCFIYYMKLIDVELEDEEFRSLLRNASVKKTVHGSFQ